MRTIGQSIHITVATTRASRIAAAAVTLALAALIALRAEVFFQPDVVMGKLQLLWSALAALGAGLLLLVRFRVEGRGAARVRRGFAVVVSLLMPVATLCMMEFLHGTFIYNWSPAVFVENYAFILVLFVLMFALTGRSWAAWLAVNGFCYLFGLVNHFVLEFRAIPFLPMDLASAKTGLSVAGGFSYVPDHQVVLSTALFALVVALSLQLRQKRNTGRFVRALRIGGVLLAVGFSLLLYQTDWFADHGMKPDFFNQTRGYTNRGSLFQFVINTKYMRVEEPRDYDTQTVCAIVEAAAAEKKLPPDAGQQMPNIICIMNETLADLSVLGELETNEDYMPYLRSLKENTIRGYVHVPVFGSGTANSEFEFLTGDSLAFLPAGSCAYESYIKTPQLSVVSTLESMGYASTAFHAYYGDNWNRDTVYPLLGFDRFADISTILGEDIVAQYRADKNFSAYYSAAQARYPDQTVFLRRYISDAFDYAKGIEMYQENRQQGEQPFFLFNVTMQNHSGYQYRYHNFDQQIHLTGAMEGKYPKVDQFLSLIRYSDDALRELIDYYSAVDEPVILCIFGDHLPSVETEFYEEMYGKPLEDLTLEEEQCMYQTPFWIWANYDLEEADGVQCSLNYLSSILLQAAGLPLTEYQQYLLDLHAVLPVITTVGYMDRSGSWYRIEDREAPYYDRIEKYRMVQYNHLLDQDGRVDALYQLEDPAAGIDKDPAE